MDELLQKLPSWISLDNLEHLIIILTLLSPFIPAKYLKYLGPLKQLWKYLSGNFGHAENVTEEQLEDNKKRKKLRRKK